MLIGAHLRLKTHENWPLTPYMKQNVLNKQPDRTGPRMRDLLPQRTGTWLAPALICAFLFPGVAFALMPDGTFLQTATHQSTTSFPNTTQSNEYENTADSVLPETTDSVANFPGMLHRVINFESEKLTAQRKLFLKAEKALQKHRLTQFKKILPTLVDY
ncbi:MAG: hypothetical protein V3R49_01915, partial [Gammaproteobacteria bacterium]